MARARPLYERALAISEKAQGPDGRFLTAAVLTNLSELYRAEAKYDQALSLSQRALSLLEKTEPPNQQMLVLVWALRAESYRALGNYTEALRLYQRSRAASEEMPPTWHSTQGTPTTPMILFLPSLADLYLTMGRHDEALSTYQRAL